MELIYVITAFISVCIGYHASICEEMSAEESPFMSEVLQLDLPHLVTMIHSGCNDIVPE